jgi:hypothetical protein
MFSVATVGAAASLVLVQARDTVTWENEQYDATRGKGTPKLKLNVLQYLE